MSNQNIGETIERDKWDRPLITPPDGGKPVGYTRASTLAKALDDTFNLQRWQQRQVLLGAVARPDIVELSAGIGKDDKKQLNNRVDELLEAANSSEKAEIGTYLHGLTEAYDRGEHVDVPAEYADDFSSYCQATSHLHHDGIEMFVINDDLKYAGSFDRMVSSDKFDGYRIGDLKTGAWASSFGAFGVSLQLALYANAVLYDPSTNTRTPLPDALSKTEGLMFHMPVGKGATTVYSLDIKTGWEWCQIAVALRKARSARGIARPIH